MNGMPTAQTIGPPSATILAEYQALTAGVGLAELAGRTLVEVSGADRATFLHSFTTGDIKKLPVGRGCEAFVTSPQGKTLGHVLLLKRADSLLLSTTPGQAATLIAHFQRYIISEDLTLRDLSGEWGTLVLAGPDAANLLQAVSEIQPPSELLTWSEVNIADRAAIAVRCEHAGPLSYLLLASAEDLPRIAAACQQAGATHASAASLEMARIEVGVPLFSQDITEDNLPQEISRDASAISFTKGCYLGQETVARIDAVGHVNRQLVGVRFEGQSIPPAGTKLAVDGKEIGHVTSAAWSPRLAAPLAIALLRRAQAKAGTRLMSNHGDAVVVMLPVMG